MSTNNLWKSRYENEEGYGDTMWGWGPVIIVEGKVYLAGVELAHWFKQFEGQFVGFELVAGLKKFKELEIPDEKILPLVRAMNKAGIPTIGSCQGHMEERIGGYYQLRPHVDYIAKFGAIIERLLPDGWEIAVTFGDPETVSVRPKRDAETQTELESMQRQANELAERITQTTR